MIVTGRDAGQLTAKGPEAGATFWVEGQEDRTSLNAVMLNVYVRA